MLPWGGEGPQHSWELLARKMVLLADPPQGRMPSGLRKPLPVSVPNQYAGLEYLGKIFTALFLETCTGDLCWGAVQGIK